MAEKKELNIYTIIFWAVFVGMCLGGLAMVTIAGMIA